jgi:hypothetical protein
MTKKGEMPVGEIRNLVRQHNRLTHIDPGLSREKLISAIKRSGYIIDHQKKKIVVSPSRGRKVGATELTSIKQSKSGEVKPQKKTVKKQKRKALIAGGGAGGDVFAQMFNDPNRDEFV